jgi:phage-related protein
MKYAQQGIAAAASYEQTVISMEGIFVGSGMSMQQAAKKTESYLGELRDFAARTPFELPQTLDAVKRLLSIGYTADEVKDRMLPAIGDITSALGQPASAINGVVYAMSQMKSAGKIMQQDLMQIGTALPGFNARVTIAKELYNGDMAAMAKATQDGSLDADKAINALIEGMKNFPGAAGAMERQSKSLNGVMSTFKDTVNNALIDGLMPAMPVLSGALEKLVGPVSNLATAFAQALGPALITFVESAQTFVPILTNFVVRLLGMVPALMKIVALFLQLAPTIAAVAGPVMAVALAFKGYEFISGLIKKIIGVVKLLTIEQLKLNLAVLANPYVLVAALVVAALAAMAAAFKYVYDRSEALRTATAVLIQTIKNIVHVLVGDLLRAWRSITGQTDGVAKSGANLGEIFAKIADIAGRYLAKYLEVVGKILQGVGMYIRVVIKAFEIAVKVIQMIANVVRVVFVAAWQKAGEILAWVLDHMGPVGEAIKNVGKAFQNAFAAIPTFLKSVMGQAVGFIENAVNGAIDAINMLIDAYNKIPGVDDISRVSTFTFSGFGDAAAQVADEARQAADAARKAAAIAAEAGRDENLASRLQGTLPTVTPPLLPLDDGTGKGKDLIGKLKQQFADLKSILNDAVVAYRLIADATESKFGEESQVIKAFGQAGDISSAISAYDQLDSALRDYFESLEKAAGKNKKLVGQIKAEGDAQRAALKQSTQVAVDLYRERQRIFDALQKADKDYGDAQERINTKYEALEKSAQNNIDAIEASYARLIPQLEKALAEANAAFDKENAVLQELVSQRNEFLQDIAAGFRSFMNVFTVDESGRSFSAVLDERLNALREFSANIRTLIERGLDPSLVQEFVSAGVSGAGDLVSQLVGASADELSAINTAQQSLAAEVTAFQGYANEQWYAAGIAQQQAIVAPLETAATQAQLAMDMANQSRAAELVAAQAHLASLKTARQNELMQAKTDYDNAVTVLKGQLDQNEKNIDANAAAIQATMAALGDPANPESLPNTLLAVGRAAGQGLVDGLASKERALRNTAHRLAAAMNDEFNKTLKIGSPSKVTKSIGQWVAEGLVQGMESSMGSVADAANGLARAANPGLPAGQYNMNTGTGSTGRSVVIGEGAVQISFGGSMDDRSVGEIQAIVDESLMRLAREIRRS